MANENILKISKKNTQSCSTTS